MKDVKILEIMTEHTGPIKILVEVLKELINEANVDFLKYPVEKKKIKGSTKNKGKRKGKSNNDSEELESDIESDEDEDIESDEEDGSDGDDNEVDNDEVEMSDKSGIRITAIDTTQTVLINLKLDAREFTTFKCKQQKMTLGINLTYLHKLIKSLDRDDVLTFYQENDNKNVLNIEVENKETGKMTNDVLKLMDLKNEKMTIPDVEYEAVVTMNSVEFHKLCREMSQLADFVDIRCLKNRIEFACKGDYANRKTIYRTDVCEKSKVHIEYPGHVSNKPFIVQGIFELKNLVMFGKCGQLCDNIEIYLKNNYPLVIKYQVAKLGRLFLVLSPMKDDNIENFDEDDSDN
jgi:proliferating cell nuclear antigen